MNKGPPRMKIPYLPVLWCLLPLVNARRPPLRTSTSESGETLAVERDDSARTSLRFDSPTTTTLEIDKESDKRGWGLPCALNQDCLDSRGLVCQDWLCACSPATPVKVDVNGVEKCFKAKTIYESCVHNEECSHQSVNMQCIDFLCYCPLPYELMSNGDCAKPRLPALRLLASVLPTAVLLLVLLAFGGTVAFRRLFGQGEKKETLEHQRTSPEGRYFPLATVQSGCPARPNLNAAIHGGRSYPKKQWRGVITPESTASRLPPRFIRRPADRPLGTAKVAYPGRSKGQLSLPPLVKLPYRGSDKQPLSAETLMQKFLDYGSTGSEEHSKETEGTVVRSQARDSLAVIKQRLLRSPDSRQKNEAHKEPSEQIEWNMDPKNRDDGRRTLPIIGKSTLTSRFLKPPDARNADFAHSSLVCSFQKKKIDSTPRTNLINIAYLQQDVEVPGQDESQKMAPNLGQKKYIQPLYMIPDREPPSQAAKIFCGHLSASHSRVEENMTNSKPPVTKKETSVPGLSTPFCDGDDTLLESESVPLSFLSSTSSFAILPKPDIHSSLLRVSVTTFAPDEADVQMCYKEIEDLVHGLKTTSRIEACDSDSPRISCAAVAKEAKTKSTWEFEIPRDNADKGTREQRLTGAPIVTFATETETTRKISVDKSDVVITKSPSPLSSATETALKESSSSTQKECLAEVFSSLKVVLLGNDHYKREKALLQHAGTSSDFRQPWSNAPHVNGGTDAQEPISARESKIPSRGEAPQSPVPCASSPPFANNKASVHSTLPSLQKFMESTKEDASVDTFQKSYFLWVHRPISSAQQAIAESRRHEKNIPNIATSSRNVRSRPSAAELHRRRSSHRSTIFLSSAIGRPVPMKRLIKFRRIGTTQLQVIAESIHDTQPRSTHNLTCSTPSLGEGESCLKMDRAAFVLPSNIGDSLNESVSRLDAPTNQEFPDRTTIETQLAIESSMLHVQTPKDPDGVTTLLAEAPGMYSSNRRPAILKKRRPRRFWSDPQHSNTLSLSHKRFSEPFTRQFSHTTKITEPTSSPTQSSTSSLDPPSLINFSFVTSEETYSSELRIPISLVTTTWNEEEVPFQCSHTTSLNQAANLTQLATTTKDSFKQGSRKSDILSQTSDTTHTNNDRGYKKMAGETKSRRQDSTNPKIRSTKYDTAFLSHRDADDTISSSFFHTGQPAHGRVQVLTRLFEDKHSVSDTRNKSRFVKWRRPGGSSTLSQLRNRRTCVPPRRPVSQSLSFRTGPDLGKSLVKQRVRTLQQLIRPLDTEQMMPGDARRKRSLSISPSTSFAVTSLSSYAATSESDSVGRNSVYSVVTPTFAPVTTNSLSQPAPVVQRDTRARHSLERRTLRPSKLQKDTNMFKRKAQIGIKKTECAEGTARSRKIPKQASSLPPLLPARFGQRDQPESSTSFSMLETSAAESLFAATSTDENTTVCSPLPFLRNYSPFFEPDYTRIPCSPRDSEWYSCPSSFHEDPGRLPFDSDSHDSR